MSVRAAEILLITILGVRATAYLFSKLLLVDMGPFTLLAVRFLLAFGLLAVLFGRRLRDLDRTTLRHGAVLGALFFATMAAEMGALTLTASSTVSFLENTAIVFVPLFEAVLARRLPTGRAVAATAGVMVGVALVTLGSGGAGFGAGEVLALVAALFYAAVIMYTARVSRTDDATTLGVLQVGFIGVFSLVASLALEQPCLPATGEQWGYLAVLVLVCTGFGFTLQPVAQRHVSSQRAGLLLAVAPLVAGILGVVGLGKPCGLGTVAGMALIIGGILFSGNSSTDEHAEDARVVQTAPQPAEGPGRLHPRA